ncbi:EAL domain-containing protein [Virgibacillus litoralis]|uniref:Diguanylate cyclase (GGDEF)-like protein/PAS domain S-box-containing protein n=1 Tax=Virgibacillus litoralis TaxID=578221 RepID=A0ABS4HB45_9BACI|nr:EAL domain-containing protein [Virgibacillus litoralis]MBP1948129.1 diguanylate cyclase (GGDEF)-like protein/PAS domain S-box-containing protein [Virgibacillus litoralis]
MGNRPNKQHRSNLLSSLFNKKKDNTGENNTDKNLLEHYSASLAMYHPDLIIVLSPNGEILSQNRGSINEFLGYTPIESIDHKASLSKKDYHQLKSTFYKALKGETNRLEMTLLNKSKETLHTNLTFIPIKQLNGSTEGVYIIVRDNTTHQQTLEELELNKSHLEHAQQIAKIGSWEYVIDDDEISCSDYTYDIFGLDKSHSKVSMDTPFEFIHPDDDEKARKMVENAIEKGTSYVSKFRIFHGKTNEIRYLRVQAEVMWKNNKPYKLVGVVRDYTTQKLLEKQMDESKQNTRQLLDHLIIGFWLKEYDTGKVEYVSKGAEEILQYPLDKLYNEPIIWQNMVHKSDKEEVIEKQNLLTEGKSLSLKYQINCGDGTTKWIYDQTLPWFNDEGQLTHYFGMLADVTGEIEMQEQLKHFATHDTLTALPNQRSLYEKVDYLCKDESSTKFALFYLDLDRFQLINDSLGYQIGDEVLKKVASRLLSALPDGGYLARISSNDFIVLFEDYPSKEFIFNLAERIIEAIEEPVTVDGYEMHVTTSIGISFFPEDGENKLTLIESAHAALFHAKQLGKNNYQLYSFTRDITSYKKYILEKDMRKAIEKEEFEIYYQPQVATSTGVIQGAEALIRWNHEEWGMVSPGEFIPLAEENHLIHQIGDWVIENVCKQIRTWIDKGYTTRPISINVSPIRFMKKGLVEYVADLLTKYDVPAKYLELEITEGSLLKSEKNVLNTLDGLRDLGIKIAIDDFGTGFASLTYLREFNADTIKIDQVFVQNITEENKKDTAIISSVLHLAKGMDMKVIAEGVEEYEQLNFLKQKECDEIQGYLFSKPVSLDIFEQMLETGYIKPTKPKVNKLPEDERRSFYRLSFPTPALGEMTIIEVNEKKVNLGSAQVLVEDIGLGGLKILSSLKLPVNSTIKLTFNIELMGEKFLLDGLLVWKDEAKRDTFHYGIEFNISEHEEDRLAGVINKMSVLLRLNHTIPDTNFINQNPYTYIQKNNT